MKLSVVIPCYNEGANIPPLLKEYEKHIKDKEIEIILVDNNSKDATAEILKELSPKYSFVKTLFEPAPGYGSAVLAGLKAARGEYIGWTHGDMQTPPQNVIKALELAEASGNRKDVYIKGRRYGRPFFDRLFTWGMTIFETVYMGSWLNDINAQPNIFHRSFFEKWRNPPADFSLDLYALYKARKEGLRIIRFNVPFLKRLHGESTWNTGLASKWKFIRRTVSFSRKLKERNLHQS